MDLFGKRLTIALLGAVMLLAAGNVQASPRPTQPPGRYRLSLMDETPNFPFDPNTVAPCTWWWDNDGSISCQNMPSEWGISLADFLRWNPSITPTCGNYLTGRSYCVEGPAAPGTTTTTRSTTTTTTRPTTTTPSNGVETPQPTQPIIVDNCSRFYFVNRDETCASVASANRITEAQLRTWNPSVGTTCSGLWANAYACVGVIGMPTTPTTTTRTTTTTTPGNGIATPSPAQPGMVRNCDTFYLVRPGETCAVIAARYGILASRLEDWHESIGPNCSGLWGNAYVCVRTIGFQFTTRQTCTNDGKLWGGNRPGAQTSVGNWCNGDSSTDGSGSFATGQTKYGCYNAPFGDNKMEFWARNDFRVPTSLSVAKCNEIVSVPVNRCEYGGTAVQEGWWVRAQVVAGRC